VKESLDNIKLQAASSPKAEAVVPF